MIRNSAALIGVFLLFIQLPDLFGQEKKISGYIMNRANREPLSYATVSIWGHNKMTDADDAGFYNILADKDDTLLFSYIGFQEKVIRAIDLKDGDSIFLDVKDIVLPELFIGKTKTIEVGELNDKKKFDFNCACSTRLEIATKINASPIFKRYQIKKIRIRGFGFNPENPVRIHLYSVGSFGEPLNDLLIKDIVIKEDLSKNGILEIDINEQSIVLNDSAFFISVQWIADNLNGLYIKKGNKIVTQRPGIYGTHSFKKAETYIRDKTQKFGYIWAVYTHPGSSIVLYPYNYKRPLIVRAPYNMLVSAELEGF